MRTKLKLDTKDRMEYYKNYRREYYQNHKEYHKEYNRLRRYHEFNSCVEGYTVNPLSIPMINKFTPINEVTLRIEKVECLICKKELTMTEKLFGNYCITHTQGQKQNIYHKEQLYHQK